MTQTETHWKGAEVLRDMQAAESRGVELTAQKAVERARVSHPGWIRRTGAAEQAIRADPVRQTGKGAASAIRSDLARFIYLEIGARGRAGDHTLRRAMDVEGGHLANRIAGEFK